MQNADLGQAVYEKKMKIRQMYNKQYDKCQHF